MRKCRNTRVLFRLNRARAGGLESHTQFAYCCNACSGLLYFARDGMEIDRDNDPIRRPAGGPAGRPVISSDVFHVPRLPLINYAPTGTG